MRRVDYYISLYIRCATENRYLRLGYLQFIAGATIVDISIFMRLSTVWIAFGCGVVFTGLGLLAFIRFGIPTTCASYLRTMRHYHEHGKVDPRFAFFMAVKSYDHKVGLSMSMYDINIDLQAKREAPG